LAVYAALADNVLNYTQVKIPTLTELLKVWFARHTRIGEKEGGRFKLIFFNLLANLGLLLQSIL